MNTSPKYTARDIAKVLTRIDPTYRTPTDEQVLIIEAPLEPAVVIAGAGSGKTETMSARVLYLVANELVKPEEILGLTFTRKAAGELAKRVRWRLRQLREAQLAPERSSLDASIMTYHSYAGRLLGEHSIRCGVDAGEEPIGEATFWQMTANLVHNWPDENFRSESAISTVIDDVIGLSRLVLEHGVTSAQIESMTTPILEHLATLGPATNESSRRIIRTLNQRLAILPMVYQLQENRRREGLLSFDDQMSLGASIAEDFSDVGEIEKSRYRVVLLDEYQDTSQSQVRMLSALYGGGHAVMAVGDPCQAIYTWRGASAGTISAFAEHFPKYSGQHGPSQFSLPTTFRNDKVILTLANLISDEVRHAKRIDVAPLKARADAGDGELVCGVFETIETEAIAIAEYFRKLWPTSEEVSALKRKSFAVLVRKRGQIPEIELAFRAANIPYEVLGVGGLIHVAEVADLISMLKIVTNPEAGSALMRQLTGPRINLGASDIAALGRYSRSLADARHDNSLGLIAKISAGNPLQEEADDQFSGSLIDALDEIESANRSDFTEMGYGRLLQFAADLRRLRSRAGGSLSDLICEIENHLFLEAEVYLRDNSQSGRRHLDRFLDEAAKFSHAGASASDFLTWLDIAADEEGGLKSGTPEINENVVSVLTIHMAKGLEWDVVAIPGLVERTFPSQGKEKDNWLTNEKQIPFGLRGDKHELPAFDVFSATSHARVTDVLDAFNVECDHFKRAEEIRLGYVAVTRARSHLMCTTSRWRDGAKPVNPSELYEFVHQVALNSNSLIVSDTPAPLDGATNPQLDHPETGTWPLDRLASRRDAFDAAVELVRSAEAHSLKQEEEQSDLNEVASWIRDAHALVNEIHQTNGAVAITLPPRLSVSAVVTLKENPEELALNIRRPMPRPQDEYSRRGTVFHLWIEKYFGQKALFDDEDLDPVDPLESDQTLEKLKSAWLASEWADRQPYAVEVPFETVLAGTLVRGRIDAVYKTGDLFEVVDWKTGSKKLGEAAAVQLALYRLAWAQLENLDIEKVSAAFHYVPSGVTDRPADLLDKNGLVALLEKY